MKEHRVVTARGRSEDPANTGFIYFLPIAAYVCDDEGTIVEYNEEAAILWGRKPVAGDPSERYNGAYRLYTADGSYLPHDKSPAATCLSDGLARKDIHLIMERPDHSRVDISVHVAPLIDKDEHRVGIINCLYDITSQKIAEKKLTAKSQELEDYVNNANVCLHCVDENGIILWANRAELDLLGYTKEEYIGRSISDFHVNREKIEDILRRLHNDQVLNNYESELRCKDGSVRAVEISSSVFRESGRFVHTRCFTVDVTERKKIFQAVMENETKYRLLADSQIKEITDAIAALQKSEERYHKMVDEVQDYAIFLLDKDGIVQNWNKGAEKIKGFKEEEIVGKSFQEFYLPEDRENGLPWQLLAEAKEKGRAVHEGWRKRKDGTAFWGSVVLTALHDKNNRLIGISKVTRDLTERKAAEDQMKKYVEQLKFQNQELEQFVYAASHDLKEPLRKVHLYNCYIAENQANELDNKSREYLIRSIAASDRMTRLIEDLLSYTRITSSAENFEDINLNEVIDEIIVFHKEDPDHSQVNIQKQGLGVIRGIPFQIRQLLFNLVDNAVKYGHPDRPVVIQIVQQPGGGAELTEFKANPETKYDRLSVIDNGMGFDQQFAGKIFEIFQRLDPTTPVKGSGIGLALCKKIAQNHGGFMTASGIAGKGAIFSVYLPRNG